MTDATEKAPASEAITREERAEITAGRMPGWLMTPYDVAAAYEAALSKTDARLARALALLERAHPVLVIDSDASELVRDISAFRKECGQSDRKGDRDE